MGIPDTTGLLERIKDNADRMLEQVATLTEADRIPTTDGFKGPSFVLAFIFYVEATAHKYVSKLVLEGSVLRGSTESSGTTITTRSKQPRTRRSAH